MIPIIKKEMRTYFTSMSGYIFLGFLVLLTAIFFVLINIFQGNPDYSIVLSSTSIIFLIIIPTLTMRLFAEESKQKTDQLLFTSPITIGQIVVGKYLSAVLLFVIGMAITAVFPMIASMYGEIPSAQILGAFLGYILLGSCFISVGLFVSVLTDNQIVAAVATFATLFIFYVMSPIASSMPVDRVSSMVFILIIVAAVAFVIYDSTKNIFAAVIFGVLGCIAVGIVFFMNTLLLDGVIVKVLNWFSVLSRFSNFNKGVMNVSDIIYYITFSTAFIFFTIGVIEKRRWR